MIQILRDNPDIEILCYSRNKRDGFLTFEIKNRLRTCVGLQRIVTFHVDRTISEKTILEEIQASIKVVKD